MTLFSQALTTIKIALVCLVAFFYHAAYADLMISPTRVLLNERNRSATINLINSGKQTRSYRVEWRQLAALPNGGYRDLTDEEKQNYSGLERIVRISPKQVTLAPGQRQNIKLLLRKTGNLGAGEYRSHLSLTALPTHQPEEQSQGGTAIKLNLLMSYSLPVIYRIGTAQVSPVITDISLVYKRESGTTYIQAKFAHQNLYSSHGRMVAYWTPKNGSKRQVGLLNGYNLYPETRTAQIQFPWQDFKLEPGLLEVRYEGQNEFIGALLAQRELHITQQMVQSVR